MKLPRLNEDILRNARLSSLPVQEAKPAVSESNYEGYHVAAHAYLGKKLHFHDGTNWTPHQTKAKKFATQPEAEAFKANLPATTDPPHSPPHLWDAHKDLGPDHKPAVHVIPDHYSDSQAYDYTQYTEGIHHGDLLVHKNRVGFMLSAWPVSVVGKHDAWHTLKKHDEGEEPSVDDADIKQSVAAAKAHAAKMGITESDWGMKGMKDDSDEEYGSAIAKEPVRPAAPRLQHLARVLTDAGNARIERAHNYLNQVQDFVDKKGPEPQKLPDGFTADTHKHLAAAGISLAHAVLGADDESKHRDLADVHRHLSAAHAHLGHSYGTFSAEGLAKGA